VSSVDVSPFCHRAGKSKSRVAEVGFRIPKSLQKKRIEEPFGWGKTIGGLARPMLRGVEKLRFKFSLTMASYNLIRLPRLLAG
jgi:hypothetical protein